jgi:hypothetical protein
MSALWENDLHDAIDLRERKMVERDEAWQKACRHDGLNPRTAAATFSADNPYAIDWSQCVATIARASKKIAAIKKAHGG